MSYAAHYGLKMDADVLHARALAWAAGRGARSGRVAWQFIQDFAGELGEAAAIVWTDARSSEGNRSHSSFTARRASEQRAGSTGMHAAADFEMQLRSITSPVSPT